MNRKALSSIKCPNNSPYLCTSKTNSFGLCSKSIKNCNNRKKKYMNWIKKKLDIINQV